MTINVVEDIVNIVVLAAEDGAAVEINILTMIAVQNKGWELQEIGWCLIDGVEDAINTVVLAAKDHLSLIAGVSGPKGITPPHIYLFTAVIKGAALPKIGVNVGEVDADADADNGDRRGDHSAKVVAMIHCYEVVARVLAKKA